VAATSGAPPAVRAPGFARIDPRDRGVVALVVLMLAGATALWWGVLPHVGPSGGARWVPWWAIGALFAAAEIFVLHVQANSEARTKSLSDIPLVIGLCLATRPALVIGRTLPPLLVFLLIRKQPPIKALFNAALMLIESLTALTVFDLVLGTRSPRGPLAWAAAYAASAACGVLSSGFVALVIAIRERRPARGELGPVLLSGVGWALAVATPALVAVEAVATDRRSLVLLGVCAVTIFGAYHVYAALRERHAGLGRLYRFSQVLGTSRLASDVEHVLLDEARTLLFAEYAELSLLDEGAGAGVRITSDAATGWNEERLTERHLGDWLWSRTVNEEAPLVMPRGSSDPAIRRYLARRDWREAVVVPMRGDTRVIGTLAVANRFGDVRTFDDGDVQLLATIANQASVALENGRLTDRLRHEALHDSLTGLPNRVSFREALRAALAEQRFPLTVMIVDLDGFKEINDTLGHEFGDVVLCELGRRLFGRAVQGSVFARLGSDEFALLLEGVGSPDGAMPVADMLLSSLQQPVHVDGMNLEVGGAIGLAFVTTETNETTVLRQADLALQVAKSRSTRVAMFEASFDSNSRERLAIAGELRRALNDGLMTVDVQPKARCDTREITSVEALVRWRHPQRGFVPPDEFIPLAERSGLIRPLTSFVLEQSLAAASTWLRRRPVGIAVNISARSLLDVDLPPEIEQLLDRYDVAPGLLTLEITESSIMGEPERTIGVLDRLHQLGVRLSVDDFGTGYSSLSYLKRLPVAEVKIDRSFVANIVTDDSDAAIVRSVIDLAVNLGLDVVAEGVEDERTWRALAEMGCTSAQGYHLGRPMPMGEFELWLRRYDAMQLAPGVRRGTVVRDQPGR
jgi:diguanylate cyclase (GGDEF)-like protein